MIKRKNTTKYWLLSAIVLLVVLLCTINITNSWFTSGDGLKVECEITVGKFNLQVWQVKGATEVEIYSNEDNESSTTKSYVDLTNNNANKMILPDESYGLSLKLKNADTGTESFYLRYKINLLMCGKTSSTTLNATITGAQAPTSTTAGFVKHSNGYYYYENQAGVGQEYASNTNLLMITGFSIPYSEFYTNNYNGEIIKIQITIECSD